MVAYARKKKKKSDEEEGRNLRGKRKKKGEEKEKLVKVNNSTCHVSLSDLSTWPSLIQVAGDVAKPPNKFLSTIPINSFAATEFSTLILRRIWLKFYLHVGYQATYPIYCKNKKFSTVKALAADETRFRQLIDFPSSK